MKPLDDRVFGSWPVLVTVSGLFGLLFGTAVLLSETLFTGELEATGRVLATGGVAAIGFLIVAGFVRSRMDQEAEGDLP